MFKLTDEMYYAVTGMVYDALMAVESRTMLCTLDAEHTLYLDVDVRWDDYNTLHTSIDASIIYKDGHEERFYSNPDIGGWQEFGQIISRIRTDCFLKLNEET